MNQASLENRVRSNKLLEQAVGLHRQGRLDEAQELYSYILAIKPQHADALHLMGVLWREKGDLRRAAELIDKAIGCDPRAPLFHASRGDIYRDENNHAEAIRCYQRALQLKPGMVQALCNLGNVLRMQGDLSQAMGCYQRCLAINPQLPEVCNNLGLAYHLQGDHKAAVDWLQKAIRMNPDYAEAHNNLGNVYRDLKENEKALQHYHRAWQLAPGNPEINYNLGVLYHLRGEADRAMEFYEKAVKSRQQFPDAFNNLGKLCHDRNQPQKALDYYDQALRLDSQNADVRFNRSLALLALGRYRQGWQEYEWRFRRCESRRIYPHRLTSPRWDGLPFANQTLLVHSEQGFGDTIQFVRYLPMVKAFGGRVILEVQAELCALLQHMAGIDQVLPLSFDEASREPHDMHVPLMSLPGIFDTTVETIPANIPYLHAAQSHRKQWQPYLRTGGFKIGLAWAAKCTSDPQKSCGLEDLFPLLALEAIDVYGLQKDVAGVPEDADPRGFANLGPQFKNFADTAGAIEHLDLVISVDTAVAHLAGAMGKPIWLLLPYSADWRWLVDREDSPWYPTMRIFRQPRPGDWTRVVKRLVSELQQRVECGPARQQAPEDLQSSKVYCLRGEALLEKGKCKEAVRDYLKAVGLQPELDQAYIGLGKAYQELGKVQEAIAAYRKALELNKYLPEVHNWLGIAYLGTGEIDQAFSHFQQALALKPDFAEALNNLGLVHKKENRVGEARKCFEQAVRLAPGFAAAYYNLGNLCQACNQPEQAVSYYQQALKIDPRAPQNWNNLGYVKLLQNDLDEALECFRKALEINPDYTEARHNMGNALVRIGQLEQAVACYQKVLQIQPDLPNAYNSLGVAYKEMERFDEAAVCFGKALKLDQGFAEAYGNLANTFDSMGMVEDARSCFQKMLQIKPDFGTEIKMAMLLPLIYDSKQSMIDARAGLQRKITTLAAKGTKIKDPYREVGVTSFRLALHGMPEKEVRQQIAAFYLKVCPDLFWEAPHCRMARQKDGKITIGMLSRFFYEHTIGNLYYGLLKHLSRDRFHVVLLRFPGRDDQLTRTYTAAADEVVVLPEDLKKAREIIAGFGLDILFFLEIGMDPLTYFLAFSRLAPVQIKRGFQITMGIPTIDYFLSSDSAEPQGAQKHYSEKLVRLQRIGYYYNRPRIDIRPPSRQQYGFTGKDTLYLCPQSLFKLHPDFDAVLGEILRQDPNGKLLLLAGKHPHWQRLFLKRIKRSQPDVTTRIHFLPAMARREFVSLFSMADAVLDSIYMSGGNTSLECFSCGIPVVTWPSPLLPGRLTYGFYRLMGMDACVAENLNDYVSIALKLAHDKIWRQNVGKQIQSNSHVLFEDLEAVREVERFFESAVEQIDR